MRSRLAVAFLIPVAMLVAQPALPCVDNWNPSPGDLDNLLLSPSGVTRVSGDGASATTALTSMTIRCGTTIPMGGLTYCCTSIGFYSSPGGLALTKASVYDVSGLADSTVALMTFLPNATSSADLTTLFPGRTWQALHGQVPGGGIPGGRAAKIVMTYSGAGAMSNYSVGCLFAAARLANASSNAAGNVTAPDLHAVVRISPITKDGAPTVPMTGPQVLSALAVLLLVAGGWVLNRRRNAEIA